LCKYRRRKFFPAFISLLAGAHGLLQAAEQTLELDKRKRKRTVVRIDVGGGSVDDVNWLLSRGYQVHVKDYSSSRAHRLVASVQYWVDDRFSLR
jgi:hypothetical protein